MLYKAAARLKDAPVQNQRYHIRYMKSCLPDGTLCDGLFRHGESSILARVMKTCCIGGGVLESKRSGAWLQRDRNAFAYST